MKVIKGQQGYIILQKRKLGIQAIIGFVLVAALLIVGYINTGTKLNMLTMVAVLGCLPASKGLVGFLAIVRYPSISKEKALEIETKTECLTTAYDMIVTSRESIMPVDAIVISGYTVCGYSSYPNLDTTAVACHINSILEENRLVDVTVKVFADYTAFLSRAEGLSSIAKIEQRETDNIEAAIRNVILNISM